MDDPSEQLSFTSSRKDEDSRFYQPSGKIKLYRLLYNPKLITLSFVFSLAFHGIMVIIGMVTFQERSVERIQRPREVVVDLHVRKGTVFQKRLPSEFRVRDPRIRKQKITGRIPPKVGLPFPGRETLGLSYGWSDFIGELTSVPTLEEIVYRYDVPGLALYDRDIGLPDFIERPTKEPEKQIDLLDELLTMEDLDFGRYQSMVFPDVNNRQNIQGFIYIKKLIGERFGVMHSIASIEIREALKKYTKIRAKVGAITYASDRKALDSPFLVLVNKGGIEMLPNEVAMLHNCFLNGSFVFFIAGGDIMETHAFYRCLKQYLGRKYRFIGLRSSHFMFHSFFDLDGFPENEIVRDMEDSPIKRAISAGSGRTTAIDGIFLGDRLVGIFSWCGGLKERAFVNIVVAAMLQQGSITRKNTLEYAFR